MKGRVVLDAERCQSTLEQDGKLFQCFAWRWRTHTLHSSSAGRRDPDVVVWTDAGAVRHFPKPTRGRR